MNLKIQILVGNTLMMSRFHIDFDIFNLEMKYVTHLGHGSIRKRFKG